MTQIKAATQTGWQSVHSRGTKMAEDVMHDAIFIGNRRDAALFRAAGIVSFAPARRHLAERVLAERKRCRRLAMTVETFAALPAELARELRESDWPTLVILGSEKRSANGPFPPPQIVPAAPLPPLLA